ncbi:MAG: glycosyltransferase [Chloroflexi bacterium]|nr:glycosyltransferase [Chloroflexota bacterium]
MRVLMLSKACVVGAYQRKLEEIAAHDDIELTVAVPPEWKDERGTLKLEKIYTRGYRLVTQPILFNGSFHLHFYPRFESLVRQVQPDVIHIDEEPYNFATFHALRLAQKYHARTLFFSWQNLNRRYPFPFNAIESYVLNHINYAICGNHDSVEVWRSKGYTGKIKVIPQFGVDTDLFSPLHPFTPSSFHPFTIGYGGRLVKEKGVHILLHAFARLNDHSRLKILGSGPQRDSLEQLARDLNVRDRVEFLNWIPSTETPDFSRSIDVFVLPSLTQSNWKEQFGRALIENMACGVPVIGSTCGEIPNVIGDAGLVVKEGDDLELANALIRLRDDLDLRNDLAKRGRERVLEKFTQKRIAEETVGVYRELVNDNT